MGLNGIFTHFRRLAQQIKDMRFPRFPRIAVNEPGTSGPIVKHFPPYIPARDGYPGMT